MGTPWGLKFEEDVVCSFARATVAQIKPIYRSQPASIRGKITRYLAVELSTMVGTSKVMHLRVFVGLGYL